jgi:hypothetical protein
MRKATVTYVAPDGDNKVVEMGGVTFFDGKTVELNSDDNAYLISKLTSNQHFDIEVGEDDGKVKAKRGRPPKAKPAELKAGELKAPEAKPGDKPDKPPAPAASTPAA